MYLGRLDSVGVSFADNFNSANQETQIGWLKFPLFKEVETTIKVKVLHLHGVWHEKFSFECTVALYDFFKKGE